jgi:hypothetical protein
MAPIVPSVDLALPFAPAIITEDDRAHLVYELHVTNFQPVDVELTTVRVSSGDTVLGDFHATGLQRRIVRPGLRNDYATPHIIGPGQRAVVNLWMALPNSFGPSSVTNTLEVDVRRASGAVPATAQVTVAVDRTRPPVVLDAPLGDGHWIAIWDPLLKGGHRTALYAVDGRARIPGRFAIDFIRMPGSGAWSKESGTLDPEWNGRGADVLAVADGTIAAAVDGVSDDLAPPVSPDIAAGNYVTIDLGNNRFVFYEHLQRGSVRVKTGDTVTRGQVIARLGSSGSTSIGPHLHFHVADANSPLGAEGQPFVFRRFTVFGQFESIDLLVKGQPWMPAEVARTSFTMRPSPQSVISFR